MKGIVLFLMFFSLSCHCASTSVFFGPDLAQKIDSFMKEHKAKVYYVLSEIKGNNCVITLGTSSVYSTAFTDFYIVQNGKLLTYYSVDSVYVPTIVDTTQMVRYKGQGIPHFRGEKSLSNCVSYQYSFMFCLENSLVDYISCENNIKRNVINSILPFRLPQINKILRQFINSSQLPIVELRFFKLKNKYYVAIYDNFFYDIKHVDAYFRFLHKLIVIYGRNSIPSYIGYDKSVIFPYNGSIKRFRCNVRDNWYLPIPMVYEIKQEELKLMNSDNAFFLIGKSLYR